MEPFAREGGLRAAVRVCPLVGADFVFRMGRVLQDIVGRVGLSGFDFLDFIPDAFQRIDEAVEFGFAFRLGRLDHQRAVNREGERRGVVAEVHQALGDIVLVDARLFLHLAAFENQLVADAPFRAGIDNSVSVFEASRQVVGIQDGHFCIHRQTFCPAEADISVGNWQDTRAAERSGRNGIQIAAHRLRMLRQEREEVLGDANRANAGTATAVRRREGLVQVQVAEVGADGARIRQANLRIHVRTVHVELTTAVVDDVAHFLDVFLEDAVGRGVSNHAGSQIVLVGFCLGAEVLEVDVAVVVAFDGNGCEAALDGARRICPVCRGGEEDDVAVSLSDIFQISADDAQTGVFAGGTGVRLERAAREAGDFAQVRR